MRFKSLTWIFIPFLLAALRATGMAQIATTQIVDTIYRADGAVAAGTALIAWPAFTTSAGDQVPAGNTSAVIGTGGALDVQLIPNSGAIPVGTYYTVTYHLDDNSVTRQYWVVPQSATPVKVAAIESTVMPTSMAIQTATKSYVDTAIAAATTGHPLDSSPLVLKAGDTMTGPLVLPADPVSSLQASTKHYVDSTVAAGLANSSTLTGQTPNYVPLATSSSASTTSSHFFEANGASGVTNPFQLTASTPNCNLSGVTFIRWGCNNFNIFDDGTSDPAFHGSLTGLAMTMQAWGSAGAGNAEGRATIMFGDSNNGALVTPGAKFGWSTNTNYFGIGDVLSFKNVHECHGGLAYASDQGCQLNYEKWTDLGFYHATILAGGTNTAPLLNGTGGCSNPENQACAPTSGWIMTDSTTPVATGHITAAPTQGSPVAWTSTATTDMVLPTPSAWGTAIGINIVAGTEWKNPTPQTIVIGAGGGTGSGSFAAGDLACVIGDKFHEQEIITAVSGSAGAQTITIPLSRPETSVLVVKGQCPYAMSVANDAHGMTYVTPATSIDGSHIVISRVGFSNVSPWEGGFTGAEWWTTGTGANAAVNIYAGARILWVGTSRPGFFPFNDTGILVQLEPNTFSVGDSLFSSDYPLQKFDGRETNIDMQLPSVSAGAETGERLRMSGPGMSGTSTAFRISNEQDASTYTPNGGPLTEPSVTITSGYFDKLFESGYAPLTAGIQIDSHQPGQASYLVWNDPWGQLSLNSSSQWHYTNSDLILDQGSVTATNGGGFFGYGIRAGVGDGASNGAGAEFTFTARKSATSTWLTQCDLSSEPSKTDLCVTSQGASRSGGVVAPDRGIQTNHILMGASAPGVNGTIDFGANYSAFDILMYNGGANNHYGWGLTAGTMNFVVPSLANAGGHFAFRDTGELSGDPIALMTRAAFAVPAAGVFAFSTTTDASGPVDTGISRVSPGVVAVGNGTAGDASGTLNAASVNAQLYKGPPSAPSGACSVVGWAFSQDGHISYCNGAAWIQKM